MRFFFHAPQRKSCNEVAIHAAQRQFTRAKPAIHATQLQFMPRSGNSFLH